MSKKNKPRLIPVSEGDIVVRVLDQKLNYETYKRCLGNAKGISEHNEEIVDHLYDKFSDAWPYVHEVLAELLDENWDEIEQAIRDRKAEHERWKEIYMGNDDLRLFVKNILMDENYGAARAALDLASKKERGELDERTIQGRGLCKEAVYLNDAEKEALQEMLDNETM